MIQASITALERRLCGPRYLDVPALRGSDAGPIGTAACVVVGEAPGPNTSPACPVFPYPPTSAGGRLLAIAGVSAEEWLRRTARRNLLDAYPHDGQWRRTHRILARSAAHAIAYEAGPRARLVLLGKNVEAAFATLLTDEMCAGWTVVHLPHPSGRSRRWNDPLVRAAARQLIQAALMQELPPCPSCSTSPADAFEYPWEGVCHCGASLRYERGIGGEIEIWNRTGDDAECTTTETT